MTVVLRYRLVCFEDLPLFLVHTRVELDESGHEWLASLVIGQSDSVQLVSHHVGLSQLVFGLEGLK